MKHLKGFSLIEVLVSLMLVTTIALALLQQHWNIRQFINQLIAHAEVLQIIDRVTESLYGQMNKIPSVPSPYLLKVRNETDYLIVRVEWFNRSESITRKIRKRGVA